MPSLLHNVIFFHCSFIWFFSCAGPYVLVCSSYLLLLQHIWIWNKGMLIKFHIILIAAFKLDIGNTCAMDLYMYGLTIPYLLYILKLESSISTIVFICYMLVKIFWWCNLLKLILPGSVIVNHVSGCFHTVWQVNIFFFQTKLFLAEFHQNFQHYFILMKNV